MKITFKNVGQGDTIILEWIDEDDEHCIGVIDCKRCGNDNSVIESIKKISETGKKFKVKFIIISHPHYDHYSGMLGLLNYCDTNNVLIELFGHTMEIDPDYLNWANLPDEHSVLLQKIIEKCISMDNRGVIREIAYTNKGWQLSINGMFSIRSIGPSDHEYRMFAERLDYFRKSYDELRASRTANLLSTVFLLSCNDYFLILNSDATIEFLDRFRSRFKPELQKSRLALTQIPHHGSKENHRIQFWHELEYDLNCPAIISAGKHAKYAHPHRDVVQDLHNHKFKIHSTNFMNGVEDFFSDHEYHVSSKLDMGSELIEDYHLSGDQAFELDEKGIVYVPNSE